MTALSVVRHLGEDLQSSTADQVSASGDGLWMRGALHGKVGGAFKSIRFVWIKPRAFCGRGRC
jgi:hypothetical protein